MKQQFLRLCIPHFWQPTWSYGQRNAVLVSHHPESWQLWMLWGGFQSIVQGSSAWLTLDVDPGGQSVSGSKRSEKLTPSDIQKYSTLDSLDRSSHFLIFYPSCCCFSRNCSPSSNPRETGSFGLENTLFVPLFLLVNIYIYIYIHIYIPKFIGYTAIPSHCWLCR